MRQQTRIAQGVRSGELNGSELRRLERGQLLVYRMEGAVRADGVVTARESRRTRVLSPNGVGAFAFPR